MIDRSSAFVKAAWKRTLQGTAPDAMILVGVGAISYGTWLIYQPAGFIVGGLLVLVGGLRTARAGD